MHNIYNTFLITLPVCDEPLTHTADLACVL